MESSLCFTICGVYTTFFLQSSLVLFTTVCNISFYLKELKMFEFQCFRLFYFKLSALLVHVFYVEIIK